MTPGILQQQNKCAEFTEAASESFIFEDDANFTHCLSFAAEASESMDLSTWPFMDWLVSPKNLGAM